MKNKIWFADISYIPTHGVVVGTPLSIFLDAYTRRVVGFKMANNMGNHLVIDSLEMDIKQKKAPKGTYRSYLSRKCLYKPWLYLVTWKNDFVRSNSNKGNPYDNAMMESFFKSFKREGLPKKILRH